MLRRICGLLLALSAGILLSATDVPAQDRATLVADSITLNGTTVLVAAGHVEIFYRGQRLTASKVSYDKATDRLEISGPIVLTDGADITILADQAALKSDLSQGVLLSARFVLAQQLQLSAAELIRVDGRYTALNRVIASSCKICAGDPTPLWEIRAQRVVHDQTTQQLYFDHAQLRLAGIPVLYIPRLRLPDPTLNRASGFLNPALRSSSNLGFGLKVPYFITLGPHKDLRITPYLTTKGARSVELRYRQAFATGDIEATGSIARDKTRPGETRGYLFATGAFTLPQGFGLRLQAETVSDPAYLLDYGYPNKDRLDSRIEVSRTRRNEHIAARLIGFQSIREGEVNAALPSVIGDLTYHRRFSLGSFGGEGGLRFQTHGHLRTSGSGFDGNGDGIADGRDVARASIRLNWRRDWVLGNGMVAAVLGEATADIYSIGQDAIYGGTITRQHGALAVELRWPWIRSGRAGVAQVIEPVAQLVWAPSGTETLPNEDSALVEFDEGNLFSLNRFPGSDAKERGLRANLGLSYLRHDPAGWTLGIVAGRVFRADDTAQFSVASGLDGVKSDWLVGWQLDLASGLQLTNRLLLDDGFDLTKAEVRLDVQNERYGLSGSYVHAVADLTENRPDPTSELVLDGNVKLSPSWTSRITSRYDFEARRAAQAGLGFAFRNECLLVDVSLSRRFTSSTSVKPTTEFGLSLELLGFGGGTGAGPARQCRS